MDKDERERILTKLQHTAEKVEKWPDWRKNVLGALKSNGQNCSETDNKKDEE